MIVKRKLTRVSSRVCLTNDGACSTLVSIGEERFYHVMAYTHTVARYMRTTHYMCQP